MNWLDSMRRERGKKVGEGESEALKSLQEKLKKMERGVDTVFCLALINASK